MLIGNKITFTNGTIFLGGYDDGASSATVSEILSQKSETAFTDGEHVGIDTDIEFKCVITSGKLKGETVVAKESISAYDAVPLKPIQVGDKIFIINGIDDLGEANGWYMYDYDRTLPLWALGIIFIALVLFLGRFKGINTLISLSFTFAAVFLVFLPSVLSGYNIYFWSILTCIYIIVMTLIITEGYNKKTLSAIIGCSSGVIVAGGLNFIATKFLHLSGVTGDETIYIMQDFKIDLNALIFAGVILGSVGAVMDVAVSISSSLKELHEQVENPTFYSLVKSGMTIGRDIMGTMANTLVLAYIGSELSATILQVAYSSSLTTLLSREKIVVEILQALVGSIGILLTIPLTAVISSALYTGRFKSERKDRYYVEEKKEPSLFERMNDEE